MPLDWQRRAALERRMRGRTFATLSRLLGRAIVDRSLEGLVEGTARCRAKDAELVFAAQCQGVAGRVHALDEARPGLLSSAVSDALRREAGRIVRRVLRFNDDLQAVGARAARAGLALAPLKGTSLRLTHYPDPAARPSADLDLLIEARDRPAWAALLRSLGYTREYRDARHTVFLRPGEEPATVAGDHPDHPRPIELHDHLSDEVFGRTIDITGRYRASLAETRALGVPVWLPDAATQSLYLTLHAAPAMLDRGLRLVQVLDLQVLASDAATIALLRQELGAAAWAVVALAERDVPGLVPAALPAAFDDLAPGRLRRAVVLRRPGVLEGDPWRTGTLTGALLLTGSPRQLARRVGVAVRTRAAHSEGGGSTTAARIRAIRDHILSAFGAGRDSL